MRYLGGKKQIATKLAAVINAHRKPSVLLWEPFCGGFGMTCALAKGGPVYATDACAPLIHMWRAVRAGWVPPSVLLKEDWQAAKALPDTDPLKAFAGFACSFRGLWFSGYAGGYVGPVSRFGALAASEVIVRDASAPAAVDRIDFLAAEPHDFGGLIYADPPYRGTSGYSAAGAFDHDLFIERIQAWAVYVPVFVSEYDLPVGRCIWEHSRAVKLTAGSGARKIERLFQLGV